MTPPSPPSGGPLAGVRVAEVAGIGRVAHGAMLLADLGADVVCADRPVDGTAPDATGEILNRGRRSIALDLKLEEDLDLARRLLDGADVVFDPYRPGVVERLGLGPDQALARNPRLVFTRVTGWGRAARSTWSATTEAAEC